MADIENKHNCTWFTEWLCENCNPNLCKNYTTKEPYLALADKESEPSLARHQSTQLTITFS